MAIVIKNCAYAQDGEQVGIDERNRGTYQVSWLIEVEDDAGGDGFAVGGQEVLNKSVRIAAPVPTPHPLPYLGDSYVYYNDADTFSFARDFAITRHPDRRDWWVATVTYRPLNPGEPDPTYFDLDPMARPTSWFWDGEVISIPVQDGYRVRPNPSGDPQDPPVIDTDKTALKNSAGGAFPDPTERELTRGVLVAEWNVATLQEVINLQTAYEQTVNKDKWTPTYPGATQYDERRVFCRQMRAGPIQREPRDAAPPNDSVSYYRMVARFVIRDRGRQWDESFRDEGYYVLKKDGSGDEQWIDDPNNSLKQIKDQDDVQADVVLLDGLGNRLGRLKDDPQNPGNPGEEETIRYLRYCLYDQIDFTPLNAIMP